MIHKVMLSKLIILILALPLQANSSDKNKGINSGQILSSHLKGTQDCVDYCVTGVCFFLVCKLFSCSVKTTPKIAHNRPDLTVSTYKHAGEMTYKDAAYMYGGAIKNLGNRTYNLTNKLFGNRTYNKVNLDGGGDNTPASSKRKVDTSLKSKEVAITGNLSSTLRNDLMCHSAATAMTPYFQSELDSVAWRMGTDRFNYKSYRVGFDEIGDFPNYTFGPLYPRIGFLNQNDDYKAANVFAARGMDILKGDALGHVKQDFNNKKIKKKQKKHKLVSNDKPWQAVYPKVSSSCKALGYNNDVSFLKANRTKEQKNAWVYWQRYECCTSHKGSLLATIKFPRPLCII